MKNPLYAVLPILFCCFLLSEGCSTEGCRKADCPEFLEIGMEVDGCCFYTSDSEIPVFEQGPLNLVLEPDNVEDVEITWYHSKDLTWTSSYWNVYAMGLRLTQLAVDETSQLRIFEPGDPLVPGNETWEGGLKPLSEIPGMEPAVDHWPWDGQPHAMAVRNYDENGENVKYGWVTLSLDSTRSAPLVIHEWAMQK